MKINLGATRVIGMRTAQIVAYAAMILGINVHSRSFWVLILIGIGYAVLDYLVIYPQEQAFSLKQNKEFQELKGRVR